MVRISSHWQPRTVLVELLTLVAGLASVMLYNRPYGASIPAVLGIVIGAVNATLVGWCIQHDAASFHDHGGYLQDGNRSAVEDLPT